MKPLPSAVTVPMQITSSRLTLDSLRYAAEAERRELRLEAVVPVGGGPPAGGAQRAIEPAGGPPPSGQGVPAVDAELLEAGRELALLVRLIEALTGRELRLPRIDVSRSVERATPDALPVNSVRSALAGRSLDLRVEYAEVEALAFSARGEVETADGRRVAIDFNQLLTRSYREVTTLSLREQEPATRDPLTLNFGNGPQLTRARLSFDLDGDGKPERIAFATGDSAFLALDRNGNGRIDDGGELFGARSGDGFAELSAFDEDGNGFIDAGDAVFGRLRLLSRGEDGSSSLQTLADRQVGALYLGRVASSFEITTENNESVARVRSSGLYLDEQLRPGNLQQLDLVV